MTEHEIGNCGQHRSPHSIAQDAIEWGTLGCLGHPPTALGRHLDKMESVTVDPEKPDVASRLPTHSIAKNAIEWGTHDCVGHPPSNL
jgi:hypothetical protein